MDDKVTSQAESDEKILTFDMHDEALARAGSVPSLGRIAPTPTTGTTAAGHSSVQRASSGRLAIFAAIRRAASRVSSLAADRRPGSFSK